MSTTTTVVEDDLARLLMDLFDYETATIKKKDPLYYSVTQLIQHYLGSEVLGRFEDYLIEHIDTGVLNFPSYFTQSSVIDRVFIGPKTYYIDVVVRLEYTDFNAYDAQNACAAIVRDAFPHNDIRVMEAVEKEV